MVRGTCKTRSFQTPHSCQPLYAAKVEKSGLFVDYAMKDVDCPVLQVQDLGFHERVLVEAVQ